MMIRRREPASRRTSSAIGENHRWRLHDGRPRRRRATTETSGREALPTVLEEALGWDSVSILKIATDVINLVDLDRAYGTVYCTCEMDDAGWARQSIAYE